MIGNNTNQDSSQHDLQVQKNFAKPSDSISCISWFPYSFFQNPTFLATSWDSNIYLYSRAGEGLGTVFVQETPAPCLSAGFLSDPSKIITGDVEGKVVVYDLHGSSPITMGEHSDAVSGVYFCEELKILISLSYDKNLFLYDQRQRGPISKFQLRGKIHCSDLCGINLAMGLSNHEFAFADLYVLLGRMSMQVDYIPSALGMAHSTLNSIAINPYNLREFAAVAETGRTLVANLTKPRENNGRYSLATNITFKGHHTLVDNKALMYPGNAVGFANFEDVLFTGGSEGKLVFWNSKKKSRVNTLDFQGRSVCKAKLSPCGNFLAYALGYDWSRGIQGIQSLKTDIYVHPIQMNDLEKTPGNNTAR